MINSTSPPLHVLPNLALLPRAGFEYMDIYGVPFGRYAGMKFQASLAPD
jgi:hypothetical protein